MIDKISIRFRMGVKDVSNIRAPTKTMTFDVIGKKMTEKKAVQLVYNIILKALEEFNYHKIKNGNEMRIKI